MKLVKSDTAVGNITAPLSLMANPPDGLDGEDLLLGYIELLDDEEVRRAFTLSIALMAGFVRSMASTDDRTVEETIQSLAADLFALWGDG